MSAELTKLQARVWELQEENRQLRELLAPRLDLPLAWELTAGQHELLAALYARPIVSTERLRAVAYGVSDAERCESSLSARLHYLRRKIAAIDPRLEIKNRHRAGYYLTDEARAVIAQALEGGS